MSKKKKTKKTKNGEVEIWTEEQYEEYLAGLYGMEYIAGFTEGGIPYGVFKEEKEILEVNGNIKIENNIDIFSDIYSL
jgi:hypothetical protein